MFARIDGTKYLCQPTDPLDETVTTFGIKTHEELAGDPLTPESISALFLSVTLPGHLIKHSGITRSVTPNSYKSLLRYENVPKWLTEKKNIYKESKEHHV